MAIEKDDINGRFKGATWYQESKNEKILLTGVGGIGSNALYCLAKTIPATYHIIDNDTVELHNIGTQFYKINQIGKSKVSACLDNIEAANIFTHKRLVDNSDKMPITIMAFDNMDARKLIFQTWKSNPDREILIDGRLTASNYQIYTVRKGDEERYEKTLFNSNEIEKQPCTFKQTAYFGMLIGARITHILVNYLTNKYTGEDINVVPFKVEESGEPFYIDIQ